MPRKTKERFSADAFIPTHSHCPRELVVFPSKACSHRVLGLGYRQSTPEWVKSRMRRVKDGRYRMSIKTARQRVVANTGWRMMLMRDLYVSMVYLNLMLILNIYPIIMIKFPIHRCCDHCIHRNILTGQASVSTTSDASSALPPSPHV